MDDDDLRSCGSNNDGTIDVGSDDDDVIRFGGYGEENVLATVERDRGTEVPNSMV